MERYKLKVNLAKNTPKKVFKQKKPKLIRSK